MKVVHRWLVDSPHKGPVMHTAFHVTTSSSWMIPTDARLLSFSQKIFNGRMNPGFRTRSLWLLLMCLQRRKWIPAVANITLKLHSPWIISLVSSFQQLLWYSSSHIGCTIHDDVITWKHFPRYWPFVRGIHRSPVDSPHKGQWRCFLWSEPEKTVE